jgi:hypothetical protein
VRDAFDVMRGRELRPRESDVHEPKLGDHH